MAHQSQRENEKKAHQGLVFRDEIDKRSKVLSILRRKDLSSLVREKEDMYMFRT